MPPVGAVFVAFLAVAVPAMLLMTVWATVTALRILFPEKALPWDGAGHRPPTSASGEGVPVCLHDILADQRARRARAAEPSVEGDRPSAPPRRHPFVDDLWLRRN